MREHIRNDVLDVSDLLLGVVIHLYVELILHHGNHIKGVDTVQLEIREEVGVRVYLLSRDLELLDQIITDQCKHPFFVHTLFPHVPGR